MCSANVNIDSTGMVVVVVIWRALGFGFDID